jgi:hypothetical protein
MEREKRGRKYDIRIAAKRSNMETAGEDGSPCIDGRTILRWIFRKWDVRLWTGSS